MAAVNPGERRNNAVQILMLMILYVFLYLPVFYIAYLSFSRDSIWPFPADLTTEWYRRIGAMRDMREGLWNSLLIGLFSAAVASILATAAGIGVLRYAVRGRAFMVALFIAPLFVAQILIGLSSLMFNRNVLGLPGNILSAVLANAVFSLSFAFLIIIAQVARYNWKLDEAAQVFGARPARCFWEVTLPNIWPSILGAFLVSFIMGFNNFEITFYNIAAVPTLPTIAWGSLRHGIQPELYAIATAVNIIVFAILAMLYILIRTGRLRIGVPEE